MAGQSHSSPGSRLVVSGTVQSVRLWSTKNDNPPKPRRSIDIAWFGDHYDLAVDAADPVFAKIGVGQEITVAVPFAQHPKFGWQARGDAELIKGGA